jgi:hypothetical protein
MQKDNWWINDYLVTIMLNGEGVKSFVVRSKSKQAAITNVLVNKYKDDFDRVDVKQLTFHTKPEGL